MVHSLKINNKKTEYTVDYSEYIVNNSRVYYMLLINYKTLKRLSIIRTSEDINRSYAKITGMWRVKYKLK